eukprot:268377_1
MATLSFRQGVVNLVNGCVGVGLLYKPFAFALSGWISVPLMMIACVANSYSGILLAKVVVAFSDEIITEPLINNTKTASKQPSYNTINSINDTEPQNQSIRSNYQSRSSFKTIGYQSIGNFGKWWIQIGILLSGFIYLIVNYIIIWQLLVHITTFIISEIYGSGAGLEFY